ncbi:MAG TPA: hypothetical protein PJ991_07570 [Kiritimatiellia bacterium]|nr:hypothetical protein [Kiritimatiellia bacterium]
MNKLLPYALLISAFAAFPHVTFAQPNVGTEMQDAMKALGMLMGGGGGATNQVVHQRQLRDLLPTEFEGMRRSNTEAGKNAAFGMNISYAQGTYAKDNQTITVKLSDISAMGEFMKIAQYAWAQQEMERESDDGYERTTKIQGFSAQETFENTYKSGSINVMVDGRFVVEAESSGVDMDKVKKLLTTINLKKLAELKPDPNY